MKNFYNKGISAIEIFVVVAIVALLAAVVIPQFSKIRERQVLKSGVADILSSISKAQNKTLASVDSSSYGVHFEADKIVIFKGIDFSIRDTAKDETINIVTPAIISSVELGCTPTIPCYVFFNRLSGSPSTNGTITVSTPNYLKIITILATGSVSTN